MRSHISVHRATTKYFSNSFVFKTEIERKDFQEILRLPWAQEVWSSNLHAPTTYFFVFNSILLVLCASETQLGSIWNASGIFRPEHCVNSCVLLFCGSEGRRHGKRRVNSRYKPEGY
jgi:hypothetical protein